MTLLGVFLGSLAANSLNLYSSSLSLAALVMGLVALVIGMLVLQEVNRFTDYLLVVSYRTAPWIGVVLADRRSGSCSPSPCTRCCAPCSPGADASRRREDAEPADGWAVRLALLRQRHLLDGHDDQHVGRFRAMR